MVRKVRFILCVAVLFLLQVTVVHRFTHRFLRPDLLCLAVIFLALEANFASALWGAFALGLLRDLGSCGRIGAGALLFLPPTAALLIVRDRLVRESPWTDLALTFAYVLACGLLSALTVSAFTSGGHLGQLTARAFGQAAFTTALSPLFFVAFANLGLVDRSAGILAAR